MEWITWALLESRAALAGICGPVLFVLLVYWRRGGGWRPLVFGLAATTALLAIQSLVVTRREHAARVLTTIERDILASRTTNLEAALAPKFRSGQFDRQSFIEFARRRLGEVSVRWLDRLSLRVEQSQADRFVARAVYSADVSAEGFARNVPSTWSLTFVRQPKGWKTADLRLIDLAGLPHPDWRELNRH